jgi:hypothetical protein
VRPPSAIADLQGGGSEPAAVENAGSIPADG